MLELIGKYKKVSSKIFEVDFIVNCIYKFFESENLTISKYVSWVWFNNLHAYSCIKFDNKIFLFGFSVTAFGNKKRISNTYLWSGVVSDDIIEIYNKTEIKKDIRSLFEQERIMFDEMSDLFIYVEKASKCIEKLKQQPATIDFAINHRLKVMNMLKYQPKIYKNYINISNINNKYDVLKAENKHIMNYSHRDIVFKTSLNNFNLLTNANYFPTP
jgi:hypothetical protein